MCLKSNSLDLELLCAYARGWPATTSISQPTQPGSLNTVFNPGPAKIDCIDMMCFCMVPGILPTWPPTKMGFCPRAKPTFKQSTATKLNADLTLRFRKIVAYLHNCLADMDEPDKYLLSLP